MDDLVARLKHCSANTKDEYLHELTGRAADAIEELQRQLGEALAESQRRGELLKQRDSFIVARDLWSDFVAHLPKDRP